MIAGRNVVVDEGGYGKVPGGVVAGGRRRA